MKLTVAGENVFEKLIVALGIPPVTLVDTHMSFIRARAIMVGVKLGVFDALTPGPLNALVGAGYLAYRDGRYGWVTCTISTSRRTASWPDARRARSTRMVFWSCSS